MRDDAVTRIVDAAERVFAHKGYHSATTSEVAKEAGVSKGLVFNYFATKELLLEAVVVRRLVENFSYWTDDPPTGAPRERLVQIVDRTITRVIEQVESVRLYLALLLQPGLNSIVDRASAQLEPQAKAYYSSLESIFTELGDAQPVVTSIVFQSALNGLMQFIAVQPSITNKKTKFPLDALKQELISRFTPRTSSQTKRKSPR